MSAKIIDFLKKYEPKIILILGFLSVAFLSFEVGLFEGRKNPENQLIIEKTAESCQASILAQKDAQEAPKTPQEASKTENDTNDASQNPSPIPASCAFLGSKNSNKYHRPDCRWAKNIKVENRVCFSSENEAQSRGYLPDKNCIK